MPAAGLNRPNACSAVERARPAAGLNIVAIVDAGTVVAAGQRDVQRVPGENVSVANALHVEYAVEIDPRIEWLPVDFASCLAVGEGSRAA